VYSNLNKTWKIPTDVTGIVALKLQGPDKGISNWFTYSGKGGQESSRVTRGIREHEIFLLLP
jgi:hypothetical protein